MKNNMEQNEPNWSDVAGRLAVNVIAHPFEYAKFLIQIGYEPIPPWPTTTLWGRPALGLPNIFQYIKYIKDVDGFHGCYRGLAPKFWASSIYSVASNKCLESKKHEVNHELKIPIDELEDEERTRKYIELFKLNWIARSVGILLSHPFDLISVRMMAQFVGGETKYVTIFGSISEIYKSNGILGFYAGFIPRFIAQTLTLILVSTSTYYFNKYVIKDRELRTLTYAAMTFMASTITYPFLLVAQCMEVNNCGLIAGEPPMMPIYANWKECFRHLYNTKQLKRGSSVMWRTVKLPNPDLLANYNYVKLL